MIYAIIVTYNPDIDLIISQYHSLINQVDKIIYIDNGSIDNEFLLIKGSIIIKNKLNLGLGAAQNQGIRKAINDGADFVLLFDQDSVPPKDFVSKLMKIYNEIKLVDKVALIAPAIKDAFSQVEKLQYGFRIQKNGLFNKILLNRITEVSYCIASGSLIPTRVLTQVGLIKEEMFIDGMDLEWCLRARSMGYSIIQTNTTYLLHRLGEGNSDRILSHTPFREYYITRNDIWLSKQPYIPFGYRIRKKITPFIRLILSTMKGRWEYVKQELKGIRDGFRL